MVAYPREHRAQCAMGQNVPWKLTDQEKMSSAWAGGMREGQGQKQGEPSFLEHADKGGVYSECAGPTINKAVFQVGRRFGSS